MKDHRHAAGDAIGRAVCSTVLDLAIAPMRTVAREHGYALAVHGSLARDIDLIAVPWTEQAHDPHELLCDLKGALAGIFGRTRFDPRDDDGCWNLKPHGRKARSIHVYCDGHFFYFDISVMPLVPKEEEAPPSPPKRKGKKT